MHECMSIVAVNLEAGVIFVDEFLTRFCGVSPPSIASPAFLECVLFLSGNVQSILQVAIETIIFVIAVMAASVLFLSQVNT